MIERTSAGRMRRIAITVAIAGLAVLTGCSAQSDTEAGQTDSGGSSSAPSSSSSSSGTAVPADGTDGSGPARPSAGCATSTAVATDAERQTTDVGGTERWYLLTAPAADEATPVPLVLDLHGLSEGAQVHTAMSDFGTKAKDEGFAVAFPHGSGEPVRWDARLGGAPNQDFEFIGQLIDDLEATRCIDTSRVYATGLSYGAIMSSFLTCEMADRFAAVAPVAGIQAPDGCDPSRPMPVITYHGAADPILKFNGGVDLGSISGGGDDTTTTTVPPDLEGPGYPANVRAWADRNGCDAVPTDTDVSATVIHRVYDCPEAADVEFYIVLGGGHAWPGSAFSASIENVVGPTTMDISATDLTWDFFRRFQLP